MTLVVVTRLLLSFAALAFAACAFGARGAAPLYDPVFLNIGINCQWQPRCERQQRDAMRDAAKYIAARHPSLPAIHQCNRNARRGPSRVDWVGFNRCIRNKHLGQAARLR